MAIWRYLAEHDNGVTNFPLELTAHLIDREMIDFLSTVRQGLFQFEIGVQSTNPDTIRGSPHYRHRTTSCHLPSAGQAQKHPPAPGPDCRSAV